VTDYSLRVGLILDLRREVISDEAGVVSDLVLDDERNVGGHRQRHLGGEWRGFAEEVQVAKGKSQRHLFLLSMTTASSSLSTEAVCANLIFPVPISP